MATIKQRIDNVTEDVIQGKTDISSAITDKGVDTISSATFSLMAENISKIITKKLNEPKVKFFNKELVLSSSDSDSVIYYRFTPSTSWNVYSNPLTNITGGTIETYYQKSGYSNSNVYTKELIDFKRVVVAGEDVILSTNDFEHWDVDDSVGGISKPHIAYGNNKYAVLAENGDVFTSTDAISWNLLEI